MPDYKKIANDARKKVLELVYKAGTSHIGSLMGCADILAVLFEKIDFRKDIFVAGKSWAAALIYYYLWRQGRITKNELDSYCQSGSKFIGLLEPIKDIPFGIGSMGTALPASIGFALAKKFKKEEGTIYCLMSDGEMQIGTTWESFLIARQHNLNNLVIIVDNNGFQAMGPTDSILSVNYEKLATREDEVHYIDGHNYEEIEKALNCNQDIASPRLIIAHTIKGKGISFMENNNLWHYAKIEKKDYKKALKELNG